MKRGDIYWCKNHGGIGSEYVGRRPCVIVSNNACNTHSPVVQAVMLTTRSKKRLPTHVRMKSTYRESIALCETITSVDKQELDQFINRASGPEMKRIDRALKIQLGLEESYE